MKMKAQIIVAASFYGLGIGIVDAYITRGAIARAVGQILAAGVQGFLLIVFTGINKMFGAATPAFPTIAGVAGTAIGLCFLFLLVRRMLDAMKPAKKEEPKKKKGGGDHH